MVDASNWVSASAAVVQALGAIVALYATYSVADSQAKAAKASEKAAADRDAERLAGIRAAARELIRHGERRLDIAIEGFERFASTELDLIAAANAPDFASVERQALAFPIHELADSELVRAFAGVRTAISGAHTRITAARQHGLDTREGIVRDLRAVHSAMVAYERQFDPI